MVRDQDFALFAQLHANTPKLKEWLEVEKAGTLNYLMKARDPVTVHQAQGRAVFINEMIDMLVGAHKHLR